MNQNARCPAVDPVALLLALDDEAMSLQIEIKYCGKYCFHLGG